ncbi:low molecular weight protein-tyrosine-phosphatase [Psychrobacter pygoscelis]|uniref:low molecular weight protein-tyrosine-phosphatase n=1 Tax=Psychrobacter pygoscelis TaxID=2488563 RepID=UPI00103BFAF9|nr:low molecular weight protein-tyrosine-phosphatase [Psychrobacter pygoscelis]
MPIKASAPRSVLLVCLGNICRSPTAEEILRQKAAVAGMSLTIDSAGTGDWHLGEHPDVRAQKHAKARGYNISKLVSRQVKADDFYQFDLILAMDKQNLADLQAIKDSLTDASDQDSEHESNKLATLALLSEEDPIYGGANVPDPYQGNADDFEAVIDQIESSVDAWIESWKSV